MNEDPAVLAERIRAFENMVSKFEKSVERMIDSIEAANLKRDEAIGDLSKRVSGLETWKTASVAKTKVQDTSNVRVREWAAWTVGILGALFGIFEAFI